MSSTQVDRRPQRGVKKCDHLSKPAFRLSWVVYLASGDHPPVTCGIGVTLVAPAPVPKRVLEFGDSLGGHPLIVFGVSEVQACFDAGEHQMRTLIGVLEEASSVKRRGCSDAVGTRGGYAQREL